MKKILITGIPGMGKTTLGNKLQELKGFEHLDIESHKDAAQLLWNNPEGFIRVINTIRKDFVITWGFPPHLAKDQVLLLKNNGFKLIWLDGNREAALREFSRRETEKDFKNLEHHLNNFEKQLQRISETNIIREINPIIINTFDKSGNFRNVEEIVEEIINL